MSTIESELSMHFLRDEETFLFYRSEQSEFLTFGVDGQFSSDEALNGFDGLRNFLKKNGKRAFGHLSYSMKDDIERLSSAHEDSIGFPAIHFFVPQTLLHRRKGGEWEVLQGEMPAGVNGSLSENQAHSLDPDWHSSVDRDQYLEHVAALKEHLHRGDIYELNYCVEHATWNRSFDPFSTFQRLDRAIAAPHAAFYRMGDRFALCMSPERFLKVKDRAIVTRPMKGTRPRSADPEVDQRARDDLRNDRKERSENIMTVDVARHDLSRVAAPESVTVPELCEVIPYRNVHQMVSTVKAILKEDADHVDLLRASFPMASMTGAPKIRAMELIEEHEGFARGLYSGCIGYLDEDGEMDMNVVIRTLQFNASSGALSMMSGGAITALSDPVSEYEEMLLKRDSVIKHL